MCNWKYWCFICSLLKLLLFLCVLLRAMPFTWWTRYKPLIRYVTWFCCRDDTKAVSSKESLDRNRKSRKEVKEEKDSKRRMRSVSSEDDKPRRKQRDDSERLVALLSQPFYPRAYFCWECLSCILDLWGSCPSCSKRLYREWAPGDMELVFESPTRYLLSERSERVRTREEKFHISSPSKHVMFCLLYKRLTNTEKPT